jgi:N-acetylneuraminic acid mutarotase
VSPARWPLVYAVVFACTISNNQLLCQKKGSNVPINRVADATWIDLPALPEALAGQCVGVIGDRLVVAGGSVWSAPPWSGGVKQWSDRIYSLAPGASQWDLLGRLPVPMAYSASAQVGDTMVCAGGQDAQNAFNTVFRLQLRAGKLHIENLTSLPKPLTNAAAAVVNGRIFLVGGQHSAKPEDVSRQVWSLPLTDTSAGEAWHVEPEVPWTHARILPAVAGCGSSLYVAGGADLQMTADKTPQREYLRDAWLLSTDKGVWQRLPDTPAAVTAAASICSPAGEFLIFGGDDGQLAQQIPTLRDQHPGFRRIVLQLQNRNRQWAQVSQLPLSLVTTGAAFWSGRYVIPGGENQPGHRSSRVIANTLR